MKELTPQVLAMYLGATILDREGNYGTLQEVNANGYFTYEVGGDDIISAIGAGDSLILRKLESMTEEEKMEYNERKQRKGWMPGVHADNTAWLLSKHFDLFGLIDAGLAIPQTPKQ